MEESSGDDATIAAGAPRPLTPGSVFAGRYVVEGRLGEGGMGSVHAVFDRELGERVALKVLSAVADAGHEALQRFRREVRVARRVTHKNAARTFDIGEHDGLRFMTMELVDGESLAQRLHRQGRLAPEQVAEIGQQICEGLAAVHEAGIIHRDLKPANVLLERSGRVVLTDFGIARSTTSDDRVTRESGQLMGTPHYMAPEQVTGEPLTARTDLYALGLLLYEMATGRLPFERDSIIATAVARVQESPESPDQYTPLPPALATTIMSCLQREPARRPADATAVRALLGGAPDSARGPAPTDPLPPDAPPPHRHFCRLEVGDRSLAVLPLRYRGPADDAYLAEAITEQLIDLLSMTQGLRVPAAGATEPFAERRDPRAVREALGVDVVVDGTVERRGSRLRATVRLLDANTGYQTWNERFEGELEDVFDLQDRIASRVAETLRLRLESKMVECSVPPAALELYMRARVLMRNFYQGGPRGASALLERCLALAPDLPPALASYGFCCARMWFLHGADPWEARCQDAVTRALTLAPHLPDTHLAAARMHGQRGDFAEAAGALRRALELAPTHGAARAYLGILQCESGRGAEGIQHIELGLELAPGDRGPMITAMRHLYLHDERERAERLAERLELEDPTAHFMLTALRQRVAIWRRDRDAVARWRRAQDPTDQPFRRFVADVGDFVIGQIDQAQLQAKFEATIRPGTSRRYRGLIEQLLVEGLLARGQVDRARPVLERLAEDILVDLDWLEHCPLVQPLRDEPWMSTVRGKVRARAQAIWTTR